MVNGGFFLNYEDAKAHLVCKLAASVGGQNLRKVVFGRAFEELIAIPCILSRRKDGKSVGIPVTPLDLDRWRIKPQQVLEDAVHNMQLILPPRLHRMNSLMESSMGGSLKRKIFLALCQKFPGTQEETLDEFALAMAKRIGQQLQEGSGLEPMWVLGNDAWLFGASSLLFPGVLWQASEKFGKDFYILPSSIHEVILLPEGGRETRQLLYGMVQAANEKLDVSRFLSGNVYTYRRNKMEIKTL